MQSPFKEHGPRHVRRQQAAAQHHHEAALQRKIDTLNAELALLKARAAESEGVAGEVNDVGGGAGEAEVSHAAKATGSAGMSAMMGGSGRAGGSVSGMMGRGRSGGGLGGGGGSGYGGMMMGGGGSMAGMAGMMGGGMGGMMGGIGGGTPDLSAPIMSSTLITLQPKDSGAVLAHSVETGKWHGYRLKPGVTAVPVINGELLAIQFQGESIPELAVFSTNGRWDVQKLAEPGEGSVTPILAGKLVAYSVGKRIYAYRRRDWNVGRDRTRRADTALGGSVAGLRVERWEVGGVQRDHGKMERV